MEKGKREESYDIRVLGDDVGAYCIRPEPHPQGCQEEKSGECEADQNGVCLKQPRETYRASH